MTTTAPPANDRRPQNMGVRPKYASSLRHAAWVAREFAASLVTGRPIEDVAALAIIRAPNAGRPPAPPKDGELRIDVGPPAATLSVWMIAARQPRGTVFVLHGIRDSKEAMHNWAAVLAGAGYRVVLVDLRGQGRSTGDALTFGVIESRDLARALDVLGERTGNLGPVGVMGLSYGGATAIQWAGRDPRIDAVVAVAPFASLREVVPGYLPFRASDGFVGKAIDRAGALGGFDPDEASPVAAIRRARAHVLLVHGRADRRIPPWHSERIRAAGDGHAELLLVAGAGHDTVSGSRRANLASNSLAWFGARLGAPNAPSR
jgi:pimeloyl-ACP methyl ester carboxylesterase